jgi:hypothetical protein
MARIATLSTLILAVALAAALLGPATARASGRVECTLVKPEAFSDVRSATVTREHMLESIQQTVIEAAQPYVADGQTLKVEVLDVDLAGDLQYGRRLREVRVLRGRADWPVIHLRWSLDAPGQAPQGGEAVIQDMNYLQRDLPTLYGGALPYERRMLSEWFKARLAH